MTAEPKPVQNRRLLRARDTMDRAYADALDIESLADSVHLSRAHFIRSFKETFGETPHRYLQRRRIERAMRMLRETDEDVTGISIDVGFRSLGTFSRTFSRHRRRLALRVPRARAGRSPRGDPGRCAWLLRAKWDRPVGRGRPLPLNRALLEKRSPRSRV